MDEFTKVCVIYFPHNKTKFEVNLLDNKINFSTLKHHKDGAEVWW
jgi:hypothetical protein